MKKIRIISLALALLSVLSASAVCSYAADTGTATTGETEAIDYFNHDFATQEDKLATMNLMLELYGYQLYFEPTTGEVAYRNTETGAITFTNPYSVAKSGGGGTADVKSMLLSQIILTYTENGKTSTMYSYTEAAARGQINVKYVKNGIRVEYAMGRLETRRLLPRLIEKSKFESMILVNCVGQQTGDGQDLVKYLNAFYTLEDPEGKSQAEIDEMNARVPITKDMAVYQLQSDTSEREMNIIESYIKLYCPDFTYEVLAECHDEVQYIGTDSDPALFRLSLEYYLDEYGLQVRLPANGIRFNESTFSLDSIKILPYFGAASQDYDGYTLFPDGSGTLIRFEDLDSSLTMSGKLYGEDYAYQDAAFTYSQTVRMPVYGLVSNYYSEETKTEIIDGNVEFNIVRTDTDRGFLAIVEEGESLASITSEHGANSIHKFNSAYTTFSPRPKDTYNLADAISVSSDTTWTVVSKRKYTGSYTIRVIQLNDAKDEANCKTTKFYESSYVGMAKAYREYLEATGKISRLTEKGDIPLYVSSFGEIDTYTAILSFIKKIPKSLTNTDQIKEMYDYFAENGITNVNFRLVGFGKGGLINLAVPYHADFEKVCGGKDGYRDLLDYAAEKGFGVYPEYDFTYLYDYSAFNGYSAKRDTVKCIDGRYATKALLSSMDQGMVIGHFDCISASAFGRMFKSFDKDMTDILDGRSTGISVSTLGTDLNSDFDTDEPYNREDSKAFTQELLQNLSDKYPVMIDGGNSYAIPYASHILSAPIDSSHYTRASETVPFFGMVYHGYVNYAGSPTNMSGDTNYEKLKMIESGASPYFMLSYENTSLLKIYYSYLKYYSVNYENWREDAVSIYNEINALLGGNVSTAVISDHQFVNGRRVATAEEIADGANENSDEFKVEDGSIVKVSYDCGVTYMLNYNYFDVVADGVTVPAMGYVTIK